MSTLMRPQVLVTRTPAAVTGRAVGDPVPVSGGSLTLDALVAPYAAAEVDIPLPDGTILADIDPRDDTRVVITAGNTGHWDTIPATYTPWLILHTNLAVNPSFESDTAIPAGATTSTDWAASGSRSLYVPYPATSTWAVIPDPSDGVQPISYDGGDLAGTIDDGVFTLPPGTRFAQTAEPGIYLWSP